MVQLNIYNPSTGRNSPEKQLRLIGGKPAKISEIPWIVSLQREKVKGKLSHFCAGSIVDSTHIVTAAHASYNSILSIVFYEIHIKHFCSCTNVVSLEQNRRGHHNYCRITQCFFKRRRPATSESQRCKFAPKIFEVFDTN